jgi:hypothetical protein
VATKTIFVSDLSERPLEDSDHVQITVKFADGRRGQYLVDAHQDDPEVQRLVSVGRKQARRGRRPKSS